MHLRSPNVLGLPSKILEQFGFESSRQTAAKFKACKGIEKDSDEHKVVKPTVQRIHAKGFARSLPVCTPEACKGARIAHVQQAAHGEFFTSVA